MDPNRRRMTDSVLNLTLEIMYLLTGEDYTVIKKTSGKPVTPTDQSDGWSGSQSPIMAQSPDQGENNDRKVLELANRIIHFLTGEVWKYLMGHKDLVKGVVTENRSTDTSDETNNTTTWEELAPSSAISTPSDHTDHSCARIKNEAGSLANSDPSAALEHIQYAAAHIKLETVSCDEGHHTYTEMYSSSDRAESASTSVKEEYALSEEGDAAFYEPAYDRLASFPENLMATPDTQPIDHNLECLGTHPDYESSLALVETKGKKGGCCAEAGLEFSEGESPVWTGGGQESATSIRNGSCQGSNHQTNSCDHLELDGGGKTSRTNLPTATSECPDHQSGSFNTSDHVDPCTFKKEFCVECGEVFPHKHQLVLHQRNHLGTSQFSCSECGKCFNSNSHLVVHQRVHTGEKPYGCSVCPKRFATKSTLVIHQRVHTREKPYSCTECRKCFPCNSQLVIHQRTHTGEKPYSCLECGKGFISNSDLLRHRRVHTGERPFKCTECTKCFSQNSHLREHQKTHRR